MLPFLLGLALAAKPQSTETWPGFRGDGTSQTNAKDIPLVWTGMDQVSWRVQLAGYGQSSPVIWQRKVFVSAVEGVEKDQLLLQAYDLKTGKEGWRKKFPASEKGKNNPMMSRAAPSPVVDSRGVYFFFESGDLFALDHEGDLLWRRSLTKDLGPFQNNHGLASSLVQTEDSLFVLVDHRGPSYLLSIDKRTGKDRWKAERPVRQSWTTPVVADVEGKPFVFVSSSGSLSIYDAATGKRVVELDDFSGNTIPSPTVVGDLLVIGAGENRLMPDLEASTRSNRCYRVSMKDGMVKLTLLWNAKRGLCHHASPLVYQGHVYLVTKIGLVHCIDARTGEEKYSERLDNPCWATPVGINNHVYFFGKDGVTTVLKAGPTYTKVATNRLWGVDEFEARKKAALKQPENQFPARPASKEPRKDGPPPVPKEVAERMLYDAIGDVVYAAAVVDQYLILRTGTELLAIHEDRSGSLPKEKRR